MDTLKGKRTWSYVKQIKRDHRCQSGLLHPSKLLIIIAGENNTCYGKTKFKQHLSTNPVWQKELEGKPQSKEDNYTPKIWETNNLRLAEKRV